MSDLRKISNDLAMSIAAHEECGCVSVEIALADAKEILAALHLAKQRQDALGFCEILGRDSD